MSKELKKYKARIFGESYPIVSDEEESFILEVVHKLDMRMKEISEKYDSSDAKKIAVLAALKATEELLMLQQERQNEHQQSSKIMTLLDEEGFSL